MGLFVKQDESRSELQQKIAADIAARQRARDIADSTQPVGVDDSKFVEGTAHMSKTGLIILIVLVVLIIAAIVFVSVR